jgi:murein DD-endopeptidase MepM/ murein hydrolase activator NlpD
MPEEEGTNIRRSYPLNPENLKGAENLQVWGKELSTVTYGFPIEVEDKEGLLVVSRRIAERKPAISKDELAMVGPFLTTTSPESHVGPFEPAIDFLVPDGTVVVAAHGGIISEVQESSDKWGDSPEFGKYLNYMTIRHEGGEYSQYAHLGRSSVAELGLSVGDRVKEGQAIAEVKKTGWTDRDHLHFIVFRSSLEKEVNQFGFVGLVPRFVD